VLPKTFFHSRFTIYDLPTLWTDGRFIPAGKLRAWHDYLTGRGVPCTEVMDRTYFKSLYIRDPDGHIVELATEGPGFSPEALPAG